MLRGHVYFSTGKVQEALEDYQVHFLVSFKSKINSRTVARCIEPLRVSENYLSSCQLHTALKTSCYKLNFSTCSGTQFWNSKQCKAWGRKVLEFREEEL